MPLKTHLSLLLLTILSLPQAFAATTPSYSVECSFKNSPTDEVEELSFVWTGEELAQGPGLPQTPEFAGGFKKLDLMGRERADSAKLSVKPMSSEEELVDFKLGGQYFSPKSGEPHRYRYIGKLGLNTANPRASKIQLTIEEGSAGFMGVFEPRAGFTTDLLNAVCEMKRL